MSGVLVGEPVAHEQVGADALEVPRPTDAPPQQDEEEERHLQRHRILANEDDALRGCLAAGPMGFLPAVRCKSKSAQLCLDIGMILF